MDKTRVAFNIINTPPSPKFGDLGTGDYFTDVNSDGKEIYVKMLPSKSGSGRAVDIIDGLEGSFDNSHPVNKIKSIDISICY